MRLSLSGLLAAIAEHHETIEAVGPVVINDTESIRRAAAKHEADVKLWAAIGE